MYDNRIQRVLIGKDAIDKRIKELGEQISRDYAGERITMVCTLRGAVVFFADLIRHISNDVELDFISVSSYGGGTTTSGEVKMIKDLSSPIQGKNVIIVEDIIDSGVTLSYLVRMLSTRAPKSLKVCALLDKPSRRKVDFKGDYIGFEIDNEYVVGFGLDYDQQMRNLPEVCVLSPEVYGG